MPSPIGHALAGLAIGLVGEPDRSQPVRQRSRWPSAFVLLAALFAVLPDADLLLPHGAHRTFTHSAVAVLFITSIAFAMTGQVTASVRVRIALVLGAAYGSHLLLDWMGTDPTVPSGQQLLWPLSHVTYVSGWDFFPITERNTSNRDFLRLNAIAAITELVTMGPIALGAWGLRRKRKSRDRTSVPAVRPTPFVAATDRADISDPRTPRAEH